ncbi:hypothetical protein Golomagni_01555 [Golovinomyces magnicellulatus]|nr:hypothetical protein Golomagni_01555 [Golovinomyces magnicellulatus]
MVEISVGQAVRLIDNGAEGVVRFLGETEFAAGVWVGVELDSAIGKNDGSVQNKRYFKCEIGRGIFLRPTGITVISKQTKPNNNTRRAVRPSSISSTLGRRSSNVSDSSVKKRMSMTTSSSSPNLAVRNASRNSSIFGSPTKSPSKKIPGTELIASASQAGISLHSPAPSVSSLKLQQKTNKIRTSMPPPPRPSSTTARTTVGGSSTRLITSSSRAASTSAQKRPPRLRQHTLSASSQLNYFPGLNSDPEIGDEVMETSPVKSDELSPLANSPPFSRNSTSTSRPKAAISSDTDLKNSSPFAQRTIGMNTAASRLNEDLKTKIRVLDKKAIENRDKIKALEKVQEERDRFETIIQKMQSKYHPQKQEIMELRKKLKETEEKLEQIENTQVENDLMLEMATLDREVAEETAEALQTELDAMKQKNEELEMEIEILREENTELGTEMSPEEKNSQCWLQMERNNERMREALIRLRDMTQHTEAELRDEVKSLQKDLEAFKDIQEKYDLGKEKLAQADDAIENLKQQLDSVMGAEDMIEELTEKNASLQEDLEELKATIADFETLKEISDEVEINHVEIEKEMQCDIDTKESIILEQKRRSIQQEQVISDMEYTLLRFRELVTNLQSDLDDMRASHATTEAEAEELSHRSHAIIDLNRKLQISAAKTQVKAIDLELRRLDAQEASEHLSIVQLYLPDTFSVDRDSILALLRFRRVGFKARLLHGFVKERINSQPSIGYDDNIFASCDVLNRLTWVAAMCDCFANAISRSTISEFIKYEGALYELEPVERALNTWIDGLRRDEFKEASCASELKRTIALMSHLAQVHITQNLESYADKAYMKSVVMQDQLENSAIAMSLTKYMVDSIIPKQEDNYEVAQHFLRKIDAVISQTKNAKVIIGKTIRALAELNTRSLSLTPDTLQSFENCELITEILAEFSRKIGDDLYQLLHVEGPSENLTYQNAEATSQKTTFNVFGQSETELFSTYSSRVRDLTNLLADLAILASDLEMTQEFERPQTPWALRSTELKSSKVTPANIEDDVRRLKEENRERARALAMKDQTLEETLVKVELLESRMKDASKKQKLLTELDHRIKESQIRESKLKETIESQNKELSLLEADREKWRKIAEDVKEFSVGNRTTGIGHENSAATAREMKILLAEIDNLQATVRHLNKENYSLSPTEYKNIEWIEEPLIKPETQADQNKASILSEGHQVLTDLIKMCNKAKIFNLSSSQQNRLSWRSTKSTPQYHVAEQRYEFEAWRSRKIDVLERARVMEQGKFKKTSVQKHKNPGKMAAQIRLFLPEWEKKMVRPEEVTILESHEFEDFKGTLGFV